MQARSLEPVKRNEIGDEGEATRSKRTTVNRAGVKGRLCLLTTGGLIGVRRRDARPATLEKLPTDSVQEALRPVDRNLGVVAKSKLAQHTLRRVVLESGDPDKSPQVELEASDL